MAEFCRNVLIISMMLQLQCREMVSLLSNPGGFNQFFEQTIEVETENWIHKIGQWGSHLNIVFLNVTYDSRSMEQ